MAMGRESDRQGDLIVTWDEMPRSPGHAFYDRLQQVMIAGGFDRFVETACQPADSDDCGQRFRSKPDADSDPRRTGIPMIPSRVVVDVVYGVS
jgi:hypothetical protein